MNLLEVPIYLLLPEHHPGLGDTDLLDLVASRFPVPVWRDRIAAHGAVPVALEHARWLTTQDEAPLSIPVAAMTTRTFSFKHGVLSFTLDELLRWFVAHDCVDASRLDARPEDPPPTPPDWTPNDARMPAPAEEEPAEHWLFDADDPYAVLEAMGDTPERPVLTVGHDDSEEPYPYVVVPVRYVLDARTDANALLARLAARAEEAGEPTDPDDEGPRDRDEVEFDFDRFYTSLPPFPREAHDAWMPAWLHEHVERSVPRLVAEHWWWDGETEDETIRAIATALRDAGFVVTDESLVPSVAAWVYEYEGLGLE